MEKRRWKPRPKKPSPKPTASRSPKKPLPEPTAERPEGADAPPESAAAGERLQKILAAAGLASRREAERWIEAGRVTIGGRVAKLGDRALADEPVCLDGRPVRRAPPPGGPAGGPAGPRLLLYHKPTGEVVTRSDPQGRPTVFRHLPPGRWIAVGRLDINSAGLLLFTDSGEMANRLMHPRYGVEREYLARVQGSIGKGELARLKAGVELADGRAAFERIDPVERGGEGTNRWYRVSLREGRNREVRRLFEAVGGRVSRLVRLRYGPFALPRDLPAGRWREVPAGRVKELFGP
ncbi:MAG TPA: pseudouridine synthase [Burkholderiales bacterium]|nr:pseudouridine synthase [Burkholderiales bacterium]